MHLSYQVKNNPKILLILIIGILSVPVFAEKGVVTLKECIRAGIENSNDINISRIDMENAKLNIELQNKSYGWQASLNSSLTKSASTSFSYLDYLKSDTSTVDYQTTESDMKTDNFTNEISLSKKIRKYISLDLTSKNNYTTTNRDSLYRYFYPNNTTSSANRYDVISNTLENSISLTIPLYGYSKDQHIFTDEKNALNITNAELNYEDKKQTLINDITTQYYTLLKNKTFLAFYEQEVTDFNEIINLMKIQLNSGQISIMDLQSKQIELENKILKKEKLLNDIELNCIKLSSLTGMKISKNTVLEGKLEIDEIDKTGEEIIKLALKKNKDIQVLNNEREKIANGLKEIKSKYEPAVNLSLKYNIDGKRESFSESIKNLDPAYSAMVSVSYPFFDSGKKSIENSLKLQELDKIENKIAKIKTEVRMDVLNSVFNLKKIKKEYMSILKKIELTQKNLKISNIKYEQGQMKKIDLLKMKSQLTDQYTQKLDIISKYNSEVMKLKKYF